MLKMCGGAEARFLSFKRVLRDNISKVSKFTKVTLHREGKREKRQKRDRDRGRRDRRRRDKRERERDREIARREIISRVHKG